MSVDDLAMEKENWAIMVLVKRGALTPCPHHEGVYVDEGIEEPEIYKYAMGAFNKSNGESPFETAREMTDSVQIAYEEHGGNDRCPLCFKHIDD
ncbi:hypothetical protein [Enterobacter cloacae complex sp. FDA-CDC-AR_0164]|uniref:hypothetical protein n=1 Tax=Enterobacter cloacae complex sp. FDA-CDC-AR_0164 TaxID=2077136 RepID=UPI000D3E8D54|nr:hypothetical protein [Enterobacter cloacae complex sp. FDA-CDC-AR_0164]AWC87397.1 hypothetical protein AM410_15625 [Enterobacter cloacae complex sp. FDA-CDC-AR_0164]